MNNKRKIEDEIKFKELLKNPLRLFGWVFLYFFVLLLILGIFFAHQLINIPFNQQNVGLVNSENLKKEIAEQKGGTTPAVDLALIKNPTPEMLAKGKELYDSNCQSCHGGTGLGDGPAGAALNPKARNLHQTDGWTNGRTIDELYKTLQEGIIQNGMAAYEYLAPADRLDIIHYIRTFASFPEIVDEQINAMNQQYNLTEGVTKPNTISVAKAVNLLIENNRNVDSRIMNAINRIMQLKNTNEGARILVSVSYDLEKTIRTYLSGKEIALQNYASSVNKAPLLYGFKPEVNQLRAEEWNDILGLLRQVTL